MKRALTGFVAVAIFLGPASSTLADGSLGLRVHSRTWIHHPVRRNRAGVDCKRAVAQLERLEWVESQRGGFGRFGRFGRFGFAGHARLRRIALLAQQIAHSCVRMNEIQVIGSHNSYHVEPKPDLFAGLLMISEMFLAWEYTHPPLDEQFETLGIRQIELDVFADPEGGKYASRASLIFLGQDPESGLAELEEPGFKVLHVQDLDFETTCLTFVRCLRRIELWSNSNPHHLPIMVLVEAKDDEIIDPFELGFQIPIPFGTEEFDALDDEIRSVFHHRHLITPDDVRRGRPTLEEAVLELGWPTLGDARGKILFALDNGGAKRAAYREGRPSLEGRVMFTNSFPGEPDAAFVKANDPVSDPGLIPDLVASGYIVRTRADSDTDEARTGDTTRRDAALASGAQFVSTDYPVDNPDFAPFYEVRLSEGVARCNPVNGPEGCRSEALEQE